MGSPTRTLCLNMIVRNEAAIVSRALLSAADHIAYWVIFDTGSTDNTKDLVQSFFASRNIPGELHSASFENFSQARNEALDCARRSGGQFDYLLLMDADMELMAEDSAFRQELSASSYLVLQKSGVSYWNTRLVRRDATVRYHGVTHEYIDRLPDEAALHSVWFIDHADGANRPGKLERDIGMLRAALVTEPDNCRNVYYLAQSYRDAGRLQEAVDAYARRAAMPGWDEEAWHAQLQQARCLLGLGDDAGFVAAAAKAFNRRPHRAEPLYDLARFYRLRDLPEMAMTFCEVAEKLQWPESDRLFIEDFVYTAGVREEISISGYYCKSKERQEAGRRACYHLALDRDVPEASRNLARHNQLFYAKPAASMLPSLRTWRLPFQPPIPGNVMNPSVAAWNGTIYVLARSVNYRITDDGHYVTPDDGPIETRNFLLHLDSALRPLAWSEIHPPDDLPTPRYPLVLGFEDARLFAWRDSLWCSSTLRELTPEGWCEIVLAQIDNPPSASSRLTQWRALRPEGSRKHQKNWMPQTNGDALRFIYSVDPTRIVDDSGGTVVEPASPLALEHVRGGSQAIPFDGGWLALTHEVSHFNQRPIYLHRFVSFDEEMAVKSVTAPFYFSALGIEFAAGLAWHGDGVRLIVSFGVNDAEAHLGTVVADDIRRALVCKSRWDGGARSSATNGKGAPAFAAPTPIPSSSRPALTFVTCLFDLPQWDGERNVASRPRTLHGEGGYFSLAGDLLRHPVPLVIFTEEHLLEHLASIRPPDAMTRYHTLRLDDLPLFTDIYPALCALFRDRYHRSVNPRKDTPSYLVLMNSKWTMLQRAAEANPFATPFIGWIDIGLRHIVGNDLHLLSDLATGAGRHPDALCFAHDPDQAPPRDAIMRQYWGRVHAGLMTMPCRDVPVWDRLCSDYLRKAIQDGYYPFEGELLHRLLLRMGKLTGQTDLDVTPADLEGIPAIHPYEAKLDISDLLRRHPVLTRISHAVA